MKALLYCLACSLLVLSCSEIEENYDPIIGIWRHQVKSATNAKNMVVDEEEWIFNDVYLGRYHIYNNGEVTFLTDFKWTVENGVYTISYYGTDLPDDQVRMIEQEDGIQLMRLTGKPFALRQN